MACVEEISKAIGAHGMWKQRLRSAIDTGKSDFATERVRPDNLCDFGKWLHGLPATDKSALDWKTVQNLHARFHLEAARVLDLALKGKKTEADRLMTADSEFGRISQSLTTAMMKWKSSLA
jgi:methyl-accepting chemotaxis protein